MLSRRDFIRTASGLMVPVTAAAMIPPLRGGWGRQPHGSGLANFIPQSGFSGSGTIADGGTFTVTGPTGSFSTKPVDPRPLLVMMVNPADGLNPSALGRTSATYGMTGLSVASSGGPTNGAYAQGAPVVSADAGTVKTWAAAADVDQWGTSTPSPAINDYSAKYYLCRQVYRNFGNYPSYSYPSNIKTLRAYGRTPDSLNSPENTTNFWFSPSDDANLSVGTGCPSYTPNPDFARPGQPGGSVDANGWAAINALNGGYAGSPDPITFDSWFSEEIETQANQSDPGAAGVATPPDDTTSMQYNWYVEGKYSNAPPFMYPIDTYQWNQYYIKSTLQSTGRIMRYYFWHFEIDASGGGHTWMAPVGSFVGYGPTLLDDSWCRVHVRDAAVRASFSKTEFQIPSAWADTSITMTLRRGRFVSGNQTPLIVTTSTGTEVYVGDIVWP